MPLSGDSAKFYGFLDTKTLGGAGFASQRTLTETQTWDLSSYDGLRLLLNPIASDSVYPVDTTIPLLNLLQTNGTRSMLKIRYFRRIR
jgi:hypothetical protein